ncbi:MAG TPA: ATP-binding protein [Pirellulaceae bacterium]|nr:ATP-binding protein [Pirellulaceae bacterium]
MQSDDAPNRGQVQTLTAYVLDLELEVDRLRRRDQFLEQEAWDHVRQILRLCRSAAPEDAADRLAAVAETCGPFSELLHDLNDSPLPACDQVVDIAVRPLAEQAFRWQQRLSGANRAALRLDLEPEHVKWFPARLRHIIDNLFSNALRFRDPGKGEIRVGLMLRAKRDSYELQVTDNGLGMSSDQAQHALELSHRAAPDRAAGLGVGLAVVKLLVEQCCGSISLTSGEGQGTCAAISLPKYDVDDHVG